MKKLRPLFIFLSLQVTFPALRSQTRAVLPTPQQLEWANAEIGVIITLDISIYAPDTYDYNKRGSLPSPLLFNPSRLSTDQWIRSAKAAGATYAVLVAKHGTGFSLWPTAQHGYSVAGTPWENGHGDIVSDFIRSCKKYGLRPGIYYSTGSNAYYGNHNGVFDSPDSVGVYNKMALGQLTELYSHYGKFFEIWYDGGVVPSSRGGISDDVAALVHRYQDKAILFQGPASCSNLIRWVGNEAGKAPYPMWSRADTTTSSNGVARIEGLHGDPDGPIWCPAESDFPNRRKSAWEGGWLWKAGQEDQVLPVSDLVDLYYSTVGNNTNMLIGMTIDTSGLFPAKDSLVFTEFGKQIKHRFGRSLGETRGAGNELTLTLSAPARIDHILLMEDIAKGENIRKYTVEAWEDGTWKVVSEGTSVGHERLQRITPVTTGKLRLHISEATQTPEIRKFAVYDVAAGDPVNNRQPATLAHTPAPAHTPVFIRTPAPYGVLPTPRQLKWSEMQMYCMICFGVDTYTDHEWGYGDEDPAIVNPVDFDARQSVAAAKAGGFKGIVVVAKHHDGLCLWPTKTTPRNISRSPWKNGKGDMIREYQEACAALGMKLGLYCSPWDRNNAAYGTPAYIAIYRAQLKELYSDYGPLFISWFDGANGGDGYYGGAREQRTIDRTNYYGWDSTWRMTRQMQPGAVIFGDVGPDVRWVGNEQGHAAETSWATYTPQAPDPGRKPASGYSKYELAPEGTRNGEFWLPAECDVPIRPGWFYHASENGRVKTPAQLLDLYYASVGRGADLDLGLALNKKGLLDEPDVRSLKAFGDLLRQTFAVNLAVGARVKASNVRGNDKAHYGPAFLLDNNRYSYWATDDSVTTPSVEFDMRTPKTFNVIRLRENIKLGQRIDSVAVDVYEGGSGASTALGSASAGWRQIATATSIGPNRLIRLGHDITASRVRLRITGSPVCIALSDFGLYREKLQASASAIRILFPGISHSGWGVPPALPDSAASNGAFHQDITIDMGKEQLIKAFTYLPPQDKKTSGIVDRYAFYTSEDGGDWQKVKQGEFSNIAANPLQQLVPLKNPVKARYFRFSALHMIGEGSVSMAELGVITP